MGGDVATKAGWLVYFYMRVRSEGRRLERLLAFLYLALILKLLSAFAVVFSVGDGTNILSHAYQMQVGNCY